MPTYEYACTACGERLEVVQRFSDDPLSVCTACGGSLRKLFSAVGIVFKGSGFYRTDSRNGSSSGSGKDKPAESTTASSDGNGKGDGASKSGSTAAADTKPAAKTAKTETSGSSPAAGTKVA